MSKIKLILGNGRAIMPSAANEKAVKNILAKRLKLTTLAHVVYRYAALVRYSIEQQRN